ncbi:unnamed protein product, partial [Closterium sp. NIES-53]
WQLGSPGSGFRGRDSWHARRAAAGPGHLAAPRPRGSSSARPRAPPIICGCNHRFVSGLCDNRNPALGRSVVRVAAHVGIPRLLVDVRHYDSGPQSLAAATGAATGCHS